MVCRRCGAEIAKGAKVCGGCGKAAPKQSKLTCLNVAIIVVVFVAALVVFGPPYIFHAWYASRYNDCLQSMQTISKGMQSYLKEKGSFNNLSQTGSNGDEICNHIIPGFEIAIDCAGKVPNKMKQNCGDYKIVINKDKPFQYEISGHTRDHMACGICVTEAGYCPTKFSGKAPPDSICKQTCSEVGMYSTAVCPH